MPADAPQAQSVQPTDRQTKVMVMGSTQGLSGRKRHASAGFWVVAASAAGLALWWSAAEPRDGVCGGRSGPGAPPQAVASTASGPDPCATGFDWAQGWFSAGAAVVRHG